MGAPRGLRTLASLKWTRAARGCAPVALVLLVQLYYLCGALWVLRWPDHAHYVNAEFLVAQLPLFAALVTLSALLLAVGLYLRRTRPETLWFQHVAAHWFTLSMLWTGFLTGSMSFATGAVVLAAPLTGYIVLERKVILPAFLTGVALFLILNQLTSMGLLPYAPALVPPYDQATRLFWTHVAFFVAAPHMLVCWLATMLMVGQWRKGEREVMRLGLTDALTGLPNRRAILRHLRKQLGASGQGQGLAVALVDLDHFKTLNDRGGHAAGDEVLRQAARLMSRNLRGADAVGRFGGEEFLMVMPGMDAATASQGADGLRRRLEALSLVADDGRPLSISASFGIASAGPGSPVPAETLVAAADTALYRAKARGRNRVEAEPCSVDAAAPAEAPVRPARRRGWRDQLRSLMRGGPEWSPVSLTSLMSAVAAGQYCLYGAWGLYVLQRDDVRELVNPDFMLRLIPVSLLLILGALIISLVGRRLAPGRPDSAVYQHVAQQYYALTLIGFGYVVGILSFPAGMLLVGSPVLGFIYFERRFVLWAVFSSTAAIVLLAYAGAFGWIPYAPLVPQEANPWCFLSPFWLISLNLFVLPTMFAIIAMADRTLGSWRTRGAQIKAMSVTDALTQVHNRRSILAQLDRQLLASSRTGQCLAVVLLDMDHFKRLNDTWGHPFGDQVLKQAAAELVAGLRERDQVGRFGGEEFLLVLPETTLEGAVALAERCRARLAATRVEAAPGQCPGISASFGVCAAVAGPGVTPESLVKAADEALYRAKAGGRNRVEAGGSGAVTCPA